jgi:hypothetical protein
VTKALNGTWIPHDKAHRSDVRDSRGRPRAVLAKVVQDGVSILKPSCGGFERGDEPMNNTPESTAFIGGLAVVGVLGALVILFIMTT